MIALFTIAMFFILLVMVYPVACALLSLGAWVQKRRVRGKMEESEMVAAIETRTDGLKSRAFIISILLLFFGVAPFLTLWLMANFF